MLFYLSTSTGESQLDAIIEYYERIGAADFAEVFEEKVIAKIRPLERFPRVVCSKIRTTR